MKLLRNLQPAARRRPGGRRSGERGQMVPLVAIFAVVLLGCMALSTDLSLASHYKRTLQNVTDAAALAGAKHLPVTPALSDKQAATADALSVVHNSFQWSTIGAPAWASMLAASGCSGAQCSVTVCAGNTSGIVSPPPTCTDTPTLPSGVDPFVLTINAPPLTATIGAYNGDSHHVEVVMHQQSSAFFADFLGASSNKEGAQSVAYHFAPNQPFPFALFSNTVIGDGNAPEIINGSVYASRFLSPQSGGQAAICSNPAPGSPGYIVVGSPQQGDSGYSGRGSDPGQNNNSQVGPQADPITSGLASCNAAGSGVVAETTSPASSADCQAAYPGNSSSSVLTWDTTDLVCEASPAITPPSVAGLPSVIVYPTSVCDGAGISNGMYQPNLYKCSSGTSLTVDNKPFHEGVYEIEPTPGSGGCDVTIPRGTSVTALNGVTFYLIGGAGICFSIDAGTTLAQYPFDSGSGAPGDGRYDVLSDGSGNPTITMNTASQGGGNDVGTWQLTGAIWLPSGTINISNKNAIVDTGQIIVNSWNDTSGNHPNPSVTYSAGHVADQKELLQLSE
jgi:Flp pilus assembly protein TadG